MNSTIKIVLSSGDLLDTSVEGIDQLKEMGYNIYADKKLDMSMRISGIMMDDVSLLINRYNTSIKIIAHSHGKTIYDKRDNRYYFLYKCNGPNLDLTTVITDFIDKSKEESKKHNFEIINDKESIFLFEKLDKAIKNDPLFLDDDIIKSMDNYLEKGLQPYLETNDAEKAISFFISADKFNIKNNTKNIYYVLYVPKRLKVTKGYDKIINVYIDQDRHIPSIDPIKDFKEYVQEYKRSKKIADLKNKINSIRNSIEPGIINSYDTWKEKRMDMEPDVRKGVAENLYRIVGDFASDIVDEIKSYSDSSPNFVKYNIGKVVIEGDKRFFHLIQLFMVGILAFSLGAYISPSIPSYVPIIGHDANKYATQESNITNVNNTSIQPSDITHINNIDNTGIQQSDITNIPNSTNTPSSGIVDANNTNTS